MTEDSPMLDHLGVNVPDLDAAKAFYDVMMPFLEVVCHKAPEQA